MFRYIACLILLAGLFAPIAITARRGSAKDLLVAAMCAAGAWLMLVFLATGQVLAVLSEGGWVAAGSLAVAVVAGLAGACQSAGSMARYALPALTGLAICASIGLGFASTASENISFVAATVLVAGALAAVVVSTQTIATKVPPATDHKAVPQDAIGESIIAAGPASLAAVSVMVLFSHLLDRGLDSVAPDGWGVQVGLVCTAAAVIGLAVAQGVRAGTDRSSGSLLVVGASLFVAAIGEEAFMPACCLIAAVLLTPLLGAVDEVSESADANNPDRDKLISMIEEEA